MLRINCFINIFIIVFCIFFTVSCNQAEDTYRLENDACQPVYDTFEEARLVAVELDDPVEIDISSHDFIEELEIDYNSALTGANNVILASSFEDSFLRIHINELIR